MNQQLDTKDLLENVIYPRLNAEIIFSDLKGFNVERKGISGACPVCGHAAHFFCFTNSRYGKCHRGSCTASSKGVSWWEHTAQRYGLTAKKDILRKLADLAGVQLPEMKDRRAPVEKVDTLEGVMRLIHGLGQKAAQSYLPNGFARYLSEKRGFDKDMIRKSGLLYIEREAFVSLLFKAGATKEILSETGIFTKGFGEEYRLLLPYPDENGGFFGFVGRLNYDLTPIDGELPKYKNACGTTKDVPYLFHAANQPGYHKMVFVEGPFDAHLIIHRCGLKGTGCIALCGDKMSEQALTAVNMSMPPVLVLALDDDLAGKFSTMGLIRKLRKRTLVATGYEGYKDPGDLIAAKGPDAFKKCLDAAIPAHQWVFRYLHNDFRDAGAGGRLDLLADIAPLFQNLSAPSDRQHFMEEARSVTLLNERDIAAVIGG